MAAIEKLRKLIREEVRRVLQEEMAKVLNENYSSSTDFRSSLENQVTSKIKQKSTPTKKFNTEHNPFADMLNETAISFTSADARSFSNMGVVSPSETFQPEKVAIGSVNDMLSSARPSSNLDTVQIDVVPDFSGIMNKLKQNGQI